MERRKVEPSTGNYLHLKVVCSSTNTGKLAVVRSFEPTADASIVKIAQCTDGIKEPGPYFPELRAAS
jgi:hypothetical protein